MSYSWHENLKNCYTCLFLTVFIYNNEYSHYFSKGWDSG